MMDFFYQLPTIVHAIKTSATEHAKDLIAVGGDYSVDVLHISHTGIYLLASFNIGLPITALAWSNKSVSPSSRADWSIECAYLNSLIPLLTVAQAHSSRQRPKALPLEQGN